MSLFSVNFDIFVCFKESRSPCLHHVWWSYRHISSFAESKLPQLKPESTEILHLNPFPPHHGPCISAALPPHAYLVAIAPGMARLSWLMTCRSTTSEWWQQQALWRLEACDHFKEDIRECVCPCHSQGLWLGHPHRWILLKCWFWVHCSICGKLYGTRCPVRPLPPWNHPQTCLFKEFRPSERTICSAISAFRRSNSCEERSSRLKPRLQLGTIVEDDAVSQWDISSDQTCADPYH